MSLLQQPARLSGEERGTCTNVLFALVDKPTETEVPQDSGTEALSPRMQQVQKSFYSVSCKPCVPIQRQALHPQQLKCNTFAGQVHPQQWQVGHHPIIRGHSNRFTPFPTTDEACTSRCSSSSCLDITADFSLPHPKSPY